MHTNIRYDRITRDWNCYAVIDGDEQLIGVAPTPTEAGDICREYRMNFYLDNAE